MPIEDAKERASWPVIDYFFLRLKYVKYYANPIFVVRSD